MVLDTSSIEVAVSIDGESKDEPEGQLLARMGKLLKSFLAPLETRLMHIEKQLAELDKFTRNLPSNGAKKVACNKPPNTGQTGLPTKKAPILVQKVNSNPTIVSEKTSVDRPPGPTQQLRQEEILPKAPVPHPKGNWTRAGTEGRFAVNLPPEASPYVVVLTGVPELEESIEEPSWSLKNKVSYWFNPNQTLPPHMLSKILMVRRVPWVGHDRKTT